MAQATKSTNANAKASAKAPALALPAFDTALAIGKGGGVKGKRTSAALVQWIIASGNTENPGAILSALACCGFLRHIQADSQGKAGVSPLAPLGHETLPEGAQVLECPPMGAFQGGLEIVTEASHDGKPCAVCWRMAQGTLRPVRRVPLVEGHTALESWLACGDMLRDCLQALAKAQQEPAK